MKTWNRLRQHLRHIRRWMRPNERQLRAMYRLGPITGKQQAQQAHIWTDPTVKQYSQPQEPASYEPPSSTTEGKLQAQQLNPLEHPKYVEQIRTQMIPRLSHKHTLMIGLIHTSTPPEVEPLH